MSHRRRVYSSSSVCVQLGQLFVFLGAARIQMRTWLIVSLLMAVVLTPNETSADACTYFKSQRDNVWSSQQLGTCSPETIGSHGCAVTCVSMLLRWESGNASDPDPGELNTWLTNNGGYSSGCLINWDIAANYDGLGGLSWISRTDGINEWSTLDAELDAGRIPVVKVDFTPTTPDVLDHFVVVYTRSGPSGVGTSYKILDPWDVECNPTKTLDAYRDEETGNVIFGLRRFDGSFLMELPLPPP